MWSKTTILVILLILFTWAGAGGISYGIVKLTGGGSQGEQGPAGPQGPSGAPGQSISTSEESDVCSQLSKSFFEGLSTPGLSDSQLDALATLARTCLESR